MYATRYRARGSVVKSKSCDSVSSTSTSDDGSDLDDFIVPDESTESMSCSFYSTSSSGDDSSESEMVVSKPRKRKADISENESLETSDEDDEPHPMPRNYENNNLVATDESEDESFATSDEDDEPHNDVPRPHLSRKCKETNVNPTIVEQMDESGDGDGEIQDDWVTGLDEKTSAFLTNQDNELGKLDWTFQKPSFITLAKNIEIVTPGGAGRDAHNIVTSGPLALSALFQHVGCKDDRIGEPGDDLKPEFALEFATHPLTTPQYINEAWKIDSLDILHALIHQLNVEKGDYISQHNLHWRTLTDPAERKKHEGKLFRVKIQQAISRPNQSLWTAFLLGCTWDFTFKKLKVCRSVYSLVNLNGKHSNGKDFKCDECDSASKERCTCMHEETHEEQKILLEKIMDRVMDKARKSRKTHKNAWHTVPLYIRDAHFLKKYPRALLIDTIHIGDKSFPCCMSSFRQYTFPIINELVNKSQAMRTWFQWTPMYWCESDEEATKCQGVF